MGRQERSKRAGEIVKFTRAVSTGSTKEVIDSVGVTELNSTAANTYTLAPPVEGAHKYLVDQTPTSAAVVVRASTGTGVTIGTTAATQITFNSTAQAVVHLLGINSTRWAVVSVYPDNVAANTTGTQIGTS
jgi:hypothetical protein